MIDITKYDLIRFIPVRFFRAFVRLVIFSAAFYGIYYSFLNAELGNASPFYVIFFIVVADFIYLTDKADRKRLTEINKSDV